MSLEKAATVAVRDCLAVTKDETLLIIADPPMRALATALAEAARPIAREVMVVEYGSRELNGQEPPDPVPLLMTKVEAVLAVTTKSVTHTTARRMATEAGARVATMPGITEDCLIRTMNADYEAIAERTVRLAEKMTTARVARVTSPEGTDITLPIAGIPAKASTGLIRERGAWGNLPSGEAYLYPEEERSEGVIVVDGSLAGIGKLAEAVRLTVQAGYVVNVEGGTQARDFASQLDKVGQPARNVAELGVGTNDQAMVTGSILEDEKILGTVHIAVGNNASMGGTVNVPFHVDGIIMRPTLELDGEVLIREGKPLFD